MAHVIRDKKKLLNRVQRLRGQVDAIAKALEQEQECAAILHTIAACRGSFDSLMAEILESHIRFHVVNPDLDPRSQQSKAVQELIDALRTYLR
jgi:DNA-binding FrmR family transcriptional regulator